MQKMVYRPLLKIELLYNVNSRVLIGLSAVLYEPL